MTWTNLTANIAQEWPGSTWRNNTAAGFLTTPSNGFTLAGGNAGVVVPADGSYLVIVYCYIEMLNTPSARVLAAANLGASAYATMMNSANMATRAVHASATFVYTVNSGSSITPAFYIDTVTAGPLNVFVTNMTVVRVV